MRTYLKSLSRGTNKAKSKKAGVWEIWGMVAGHTFSFSTLFLLSFWFLIGVFDFPCGGEEKRERG